MPNYGFADTSYKAAGEEAGLRKLADDFYQAMGELEQAQKILHMHLDKEGADIKLSAEKLALFLCGWLGGPKLFREKWGPIAIPTAHKHLEIGYAERDAWMDCMQVAVSKADWDDDSKRYFLQQIFRPARIIRNTDDGLRDEMKEQF